MFSGRRHGYTGAPCGVLSHLSSGQPSYPPRSSRQDPKYINDTDKEWLHEIQAMVLREGRSGKDITVS